MYGMVNKAIEQMVVAGHGEEVWERMKEKAGVDIEVFISNHGYPDEVTYSLVAAASETLGMPPEEVLESFGIHWILHTAHESYGDMMAAGGSTFGEFLVNLPQFHSRVSMIFPHLMPPGFACSDVEEKRLRLHYLSGREGLAPFVIGLIKGLGQHFKTPIQIEHALKKADGADHDEFVIAW